MMIKIGELRYKNGNKVIAELFYNESDCYIYERYKENGKTFQIRRGIFGRSLKDATNKTVNLYRENENWNLIFIERKGALK